MVLKLSIFKSNLYISKKNSNIDILPEFRKNIIFDQQNLIKPLCRRFCTRYLESIQTIFDDPLSCPIPNINKTSPGFIDYSKVRQGALDYVSGFCNSSTIRRSADESNCVLANIQELNHCGKYIFLQFNPFLTALHFLGFATLEDSLTFCHVYPTDECCSHMYNSIDSILNGTENILPTFYTLISILSFLVLLFAFFLLRSIKKNRMNRTTDLNKIDNPGSSTSRLWHIFCCLPSEIISINSSADNTKAKLIHPPSQVSSSISAHDPSPIDPHPPKNTALTIEDARGESLYHVASEVHATQNNKKHLVLFNYQAKMEDEINLVVGDWVQLRECYDDGWCWGYLESKGVEGAFPSACLDLQSSPMTPINENPTRSPQTLHSEVNINILSVEENRMSSSSALSSPRLMEDGEHNLLPMANPKTHFDELLK